MRWETNVNFEVGANCPHFPKWSKMVQYGIKTDHLEHLGDHGPEMIQNGIEDDNPGQGYVSFNQPLRRVCVLQPTLPRGMCPSTKPSEGYVSFNQPFRGVCVLQPTLPRGYVSFNQPFRGVCVLQPPPPKMYPSTNPSEGVRANFQCVKVGAKVHPTGGGRIFVL